MEFGRIELTQKITGRLKVALTIATGDTLPARTPFAIEPVLRRLNPGEQTVSTEALIKGIALFDSLYKLTLDPKWLERLNSARQALLGLKNQIPPVFFKKEAGLTPATRVVNPTLGTVVYSRTPDQLVRLSLPRIHVQSFEAVELKSDRAVSFGQDTLSIEAGLQTNGFVQIRLRLKNLTDYVFLLAVEGNDIRTRFVGLQSFCTWDARTLWRSPETGDRDFGATGTVETNAANSIVEGRVLPVLAIALKANFDFAIYRIRKDLGTVPPKIAYSLTGSPIFLQLEDGSGIQWKAQIQPTEGTFLVRQFVWSDFSTLDDGMRPDVTHSIRQVEFIGGREASVLSLAYIGESPTFLSDEGEMIELGVGALPIETVEQILWVGEVGIVLREQKQEGVLPVELKINSTTSAIAPSQWYRHPLFWRQAGETEIVRSIYRQLDPLEPPEWEEWIDSVENIAADWMAQKNNETAAAIVMEFVAALDDAPDDTWKNRAASILTIAILANLSGGDRRLTFKAIVKSFELIKSAPKISIEAIPATFEALSLLSKNREYLFYPLPSDLGDTESGYRSKTLSYIAFDPAIELPRESSYGARFRVPVQNRYNWGKQ